MRAGFTLIEVMVAVAVASLLIAGVTASTQGAVRAAERQKRDAGEEERRARAVEVFRQDWRGRVHLAKSRVPRPAGGRLLLFSTTSDSLWVPGARATRLVSYVVSEKGLSRGEGDSEVLLLPGPVGLEFWDGVAWRAEPGGREPAVRLLLQNPEETIVFR